jgi:hypothetical protein
VKTREEAPAQAEVIPINTGLGSEALAAV